MVEDCMFIKVTLCELPISLIKLLKLTKGLRKYIFIELEEFYSIFLHRGVGVVYREKHKEECLLHSIRIGFGSSLTYSLQNGCQ